MNEDRPVRLNTVSREYNSDVIVEALRELNYQYIPMTPGSSFRGVHDSLVNYLGNERPQMILCLHEEVAISVAHGFTTVTDGACPVLIHDLVGLMNGSMAVYNAFCGQAPVVVLGGGGPISRGTEGRRPIDDLHSAQSQGELIREYVKWVDDPCTLMDTVAGIYRAHQIAVSAPAGPVYLTMDVDMQEGRIAGDYVTPEVADFTPAPPFAADLEQVAAAARLLVDASLPLIIVGGRLVHVPGAPQLLAELAESLGAAVDGSALPSTHPLNVTGTNAVGDADVLLCIDVGDMASTLGTGLGNRPGRTGDRKLIDLSTGDLRLKSWGNAFSAPFRRDVQLLSDPVAGLRALVPAVREIANASVAQTRAAVVRDRVQEVRARQLSHVAEHWDDRPISSGRFTSELWDAVRSTDWLLTSRGGRLWHEGIFEFTDSRQTIASAGGGGGVGYNTGAAVGAALAARDRGQIAIAVVGDGDFFMAHSALWTAVHYHLPLLLVINDNHSFFNDEEHQRRLARLRNRPRENSWIGVHIDEPAVDFASIGRAFGCHAEGPIENPADLHSALHAAVNAVLSGEVALVHVVTEAISDE